MQENKKLSNIILRIISALCIGTTFIIAIFFSKTLYIFLMLIIAAGMLYEWYNITSSSLRDCLLGLIIIPYPLFCLILCAIKINPWQTFSYFATIWAMDSCAMFGGKMIGGPKLAPKTSPNKTWSGLLIGLIGVFITTKILLIFKTNEIINFSSINVRNMSLFYLFIGLIAQGSDLFISHFKRKFRVKDSGSIIPGHGGVLDRFDSIIFSAPFFYYMI